MSSSLQQDVKCPCGEVTQAELWSSINVHNDPEIKENILSGQLNVIKCSACGQYIYAERFLLYHDPAAELMVFVYPTDHDAEKEKWRTRTEHDFKTAQDSLEPHERLAYRPLTLFGLDDLVGLLVNEQEQADQGDIIESMSVAARFDVLKLNPYIARKNNVPTRLPLGKEVHDPWNERLKSGIKLLLGANDRLSVYADLSKRPVDWKAILNEMEIVDKHRSKGH